MSISRELGEQREITVQGQRIRYRTTGDGSAVVFVHGLLVNGDLWRGVVPTVAAAGHRCITPDWPLGSHEVAVPGADLTPPGVARLIADFLAELDLYDVTIVANDTGGALTQLLITADPSRIGRVVFTPSDCFDRFFPPLFAMLPRLAHVPGATWLLAQLLRWRAVQRLPIAFGWLAKRPIAAEIADSFTAPSRRDRAVRADLRRFMSGVHKRYTLAAAEQFGGFDKPVLLAWAAEDRLFPITLGRRLAAAFPNANLVEVGDSYTFVPLDQPAMLAGLIVEFTGAHAAA
jgi:pimeloyl-ACP methyl ester carboxylesterase